MTTASKAAYANPANEQVREFNKARIMRFFKEEVYEGTAFTIREIADFIELTYPQVQKRVSDLVQEGKLWPCGEKLENGNLNSLYMMATKKRVKPRVKQSKFNTLTEAAQNVLIAEDWDRVRKEYERLNKSQKNKPLINNNLLYL